MGERDWMGGSALLRVVSLSEELLNACAKEGRDWGTDMARTRKKKKKRRNRKSLSMATRDAFGISQPLVSRNVWHLIKSTRLPVCVAPRRQAASHQ